MIFFSPALLNCRTSVSLLQSKNKSTWISTAWTKHSSLSAWSARVYLVKYDIFCVILWYDAGAVFYLVDEFAFSVLFHRFRFSYCVVCFFFFGDTFICSATLLLHVAAPSRTGTLPLALDKNIWPDRNNRGNAALTHPLHSPEASPADKHTWNTELCVIYIVVSKTSVLRFMLCAVIRDVLVRQQKHRYICLSFSFRFNFADKSCWFSWSS